MSCRFTREHPTIAARIQRWDQVHDAILPGAPYHSDDAAILNNRGQHSIVHGDLNCSNFFYVEGEQSLSVFDWDQTQQGSYLWDVSQESLTLLSKTKFIK
jgi:aminoglycoside phosphotransferase (APT) family kinase protein